VVGDAVGAPVELCVGEPLVVAFDGQRVGCRGGLLRDQLVQAGMRIGSRGVVELDEQPRPLLLPQLVVLLRGLRDLFRGNYPSPPCMKMS
jgi:hypothetical protein